MQHYIARLTSRQLLPGVELDSQSPAYGRYVTRASINKFDSPALRVVLTKGPVRSSALEK